MQRNVTKPKDVKFKQRNFRREINYNQFSARISSVVPTNTVTEITECYEQQFHS